MENINIRRNQLNRKKTRDTKKKITVLKWIALGVVLATAVTFSYLWTVKDNNAVADSAIILSPNEEIETYSENSTYSNLSIGFKKVLVDTQVFSGVSENPKALLTLNKGEYIEHLGTVEGWTKVKHKNITGFVKGSDLVDTNQNELVIVDGVLVVTKDYSIPKDFETRFDVETESSMMVMFEAMKRENLDISVSRRYIQSDEIVVQEDGKYAFPDIEHHALRTGRAVELTIPNSATVVDFSDTAQGKWLKSNAHKYGFVLAYPEGKEELTGFVSNDRIYIYVGTQNAINMHSRDLTIQEYFVKN